MHSSPHHQPFRNFLTTLYFLGSGWMFYRHDKRRTGTRRKAFRQDRSAEAFRLVTWQYTEQIRAWQHRQRRRMGVSAPQTGAIAVWKMLWAQAWVNTHITYVRDPILYGERDYWAVAEETLAQRQGDCEDLAVLLIWLLRRMGFPDHCLGVALSLEADQEGGHAFALVQDGPDDFWVLDNGTYAWFPVRASYLFESRPQVLVFGGFNFFDIWNY